MLSRTDLAIEKNLPNDVDTAGIESECYTKGDTTVTQMRVINDAGAAALGKPIGTYVTVDIPNLVTHGGEDEPMSKIISAEIRKMLPEKYGTVLVVGLGNRGITPDALGPKTAERILATRHISKNLAEEIGLSSMKSVAVLSPGVLGQTGIEVVEIILAVVQKIKPVAVVVIDALAAKNVARIGSTVQLTDTGISPGAGVNNSRKEISRQTLGIPVIAIGMPTVVDAPTLISDITDSDNFNNGMSNMIVTPREIDMLTDRASELMSHAINCALQPEIDSELLKILV